VQSVVSLKKFCSAVQMPLSYPIEDFFIASANQYGASNLPRTSGPPGPLE
jgi:hypothetical protein